MQKNCISSALNRVLTLLLFLLNIIIRWQYKKSNVMELN